MFVRADGPAPESRAVEKAHKLLGPAREFRVRIPDDVHVREGRAVSRLGATARSEQPQEPIVEVGPLQPRRIGQRHRTSGARARPTTTGPLGHNEAHKYADGNDHQAELELEVMDNGPGFPEMVLDHPFEPYVTNKSSGSGLGLAICRKIVSEHNGKISLSNRPKGGARVSIRFPLNLPVDNAPSN